MPVGDRHIEILEDADISRRLHALAIGGYGHEIIFAIIVKFPGKIAEEIHRTLQNADKDWIFTLIFLGKPCGKLLDPVFERWFINENMVNIAVKVDFLWHN